MSLPFRNWLPGALLLLATGCLHPVREQVDSTVCELANQVVDPQSPEPAKVTSRNEIDASEPTIVQTSAQQPKDEQKKLADRLQIPPELPGAQARPIELPDSKAPRAERLAAYDKIYQPPPSLGTDPEFAPGPDGRPLALADLQRLALASSPLLRAAVSDVEAARGAARQAGLPPNPTIGFESDNVNTGGTAGYQGGFIDQVIKTGNKLKVQQAAALMDLRNAELALKRARFDLASQVRANYFAVLVAQENVKVTKALLRFTNEAYKIQVEIVKGEGDAAPYEPMQLRVLSNQAAGALLFARNRYTAAWKQLASTLGLPGMPPTALAGRIDSGIPVFDYEKALARVLSQHTDVETAENTIQKARYNLRLAQLMPIPDVDVRVIVQKDFTAPPFQIVHGVQVGVPVPIWDRNQGNIAQAQANLLHAIEEPHRVRADLTSRLAEAFERYDDNRKLLALYRDQILPDQVRVYRGIYLRHQEFPDVVTFGDVVTAQQTLAQAITTYVQTLQLQWTAIVDVANLLQTSDLFNLGIEVQEPQCVAPIPDLEHLPALPCDHPCSPLPDPALKGADGRWPVSPAKN
jgi:cobalt-zinc-cadmium efflux system outer membrane protein